MKVWLNVNAIADLMGCCLCIYFRALLFTQDFISCSRALSFHHLCGTHFSVYHSSIHTYMCGILKLGHFGQSILGLHCEQSQCQTVGQTQASAVTALLVSTVRQRGIRTTVCYLLLRVAAFYLKLPGFGTEPQ